MGDPQHWDAVYSSKAETETSWFATDVEPSLRLVHDCAAPPARVLDLGAGRSRLCSRLADEGYAASALDISAQALAQLRQADSRIDTITADVTRWVPQKQYDVIHDRAVFHFLVDKADRAAYRQNVMTALAPSGRLILGTFALDGPDACSGLPVTRWSATGLAEELGMVLVHDEQHDHVTPWDTHQDFTWAILTRAALTS